MCSETFTILRNGMDVIKSLDSKFLLSFVLSVAMNQGTVISGANRIAGSATSQATAIIPGQTKLVAGQNTILATSGRLGTHLVSGQPAVFTATARIASTGWLAFF